MATAQGAAEGAAAPIGRWPATVLVVVGLAVATAVAAGAPAPQAALAGVAAGLLLGLGPRVLDWRAQIGAILAVILLVPIRRFTLPVDLPFELELYRILVVVLAAGWLTSVLIDPRVQLRASGLEAPIVAVVFVTVASVAANLDRVSTVKADVVKSITFFVSFFVLFYAIVSLVRDRRAIELMVGVLVIAGAIVAAFAVVEARSGYNAFDDLARVVPVLEPARDVAVDTRGGRLRTVASAQHPIALGAALVMLLPLALFMARRATYRWLWVACAVLLILGAVGTVSRTSILMLATVAVVFLVLRPRPTVRVLAIGLIPMLIAVHLVLPGTIGALRNAFLPEGGIVAEQAGGEGNRGAGRIADLSPALEEFSQTPLVGQGFGTRVTDVERQNADILDNQWLKALLETGVVGVAAWLWLIGAGVIRLGRAARWERGPTGLLLTGITASVAAFAVGMLTYDAFSFIQVTLLFFVLLALGCCAVRLQREEAA